MKVHAPLLLLLVAPPVAPFAPPAPFLPAVAVAAARPGLRLSPVPEGADALGHVVDAVLSSSSTFLADLQADALANADAIAQAAPDGAADAAADAAASNGWFGFLTLPIETLLQFLHTGLANVGVPNAWGLSIILMTVLIKAATFPLTKSQLESTNKMQALQPTIKGIQAKYQSNPEVMNQKISEVYQTNEVNPLAGCIPSIVQIPVFIGLYRAVLGLAKDNALDESFLFLPNLEGPTYGADPAHGSDWLLKGWVDGVPSLGWQDTLAFVSIPIFLVISQFVSMNLMQPKLAEGAEPPAGNAVLKVLPFMIGWFALNVPAALGIYWVINNIVTTVSTLYVRSTMPPPAAVAEGAGGSSAVVQASTTNFNPTPMNERAAGFGGGGGGGAGGDGMTTITPMDAEIVPDDDEELLGGDVREQVPAATSSKKRGGSKKKKKRRKN